MANNILSRSPWLRQALEYIRNNPGETKREVIEGTYSTHGNVQSVPGKTYQYRLRALDKLLNAGLVKNEGKPNKFSLVAVAEEEIE